MSRPDDYDELLAGVCAGLESSDFAVVRRQVIRAKAAATDDEERGSLTAFELAFDLADMDGVRQRVLDLVSESTDEIFLSGCACTLSDVGEERGQSNITELAELVFSASKVPAPSWRFLANHAVVLERLERFQDAADTFGRATRLAPNEDHADLAVRRAACLHKAGDLDAARDAYLDYLAANPKDAHEWISLAIVESDAGRYDEAQKAYWRAGGLEPNNLSLHYNWFITALRANRSELAADACARLRAIDASDWRTGLAAARLREQAGDPAAGFRDALNVFEREAEDCDLSSADDRWRLEHIATWALHIAESCDPAESEVFIARLCRDWILSDDIIAAIRRLETPALASLAEYWVLVEAVAASPEPPTSAYLLKYRIFADTAEQAAELAIAFERRCGAVEARAIEVQVVDEERRARYRGPAWRAQTAHAFSIEEYGKD